jgi:shikimate dehydrogenase
MTVPKACVIGWPVGHSRSPLIHGYWLERYAIAGAYEKLEIPPSGLENFLRGLPDSAYLGCNVTLPHKEGAFRTVKVTDDTTRKLGVVNTVYLHEGEVFGISTDGLGFVQSLLTNAPGFTPHGKHFTILGAGGAARAIVGTLIDFGAETVVVLNRTPEKAETLRLQFGVKVRNLDWRIRSEVLDGTDVLVNTTSLGMKGQPPLEIDLGRLRRDALVADIVYIPLETALLKQARDQGNRVIRGLNMLLYQAVPGFELWFGRKPEVTRELYDLVAADIGKVP